MRPTSSNKKYYSWRGSHLCTHVTKPYGSFTRPSKSRRYVKLLAYVAHCPGLKRREITEVVFGFKTPLNYGDRGYASNLYATLLDADLLDMDCEYRYFITEKGMKILESVGINA